MLSLNAPDSALFTKSGSAKLSYKISFSGFILFFRLLLGFLRTIDAIDESCEEREEEDNCEFCVFRLFLENLILKREGSGA